MICFITIRMETEEERYLLGNGLDVTCSVPCMYTKYRGFNTVKLLRAVKLPTGALPSLFSTGVPLVIFSSRTTGKLCGGSYQNTLL